MRRCLRRPLCAGRNSPVGASVRAGLRTADTGSNRSEGLLDGNRIVLYGSAAGAETADKFFLQPPA